MAELQKVSYQHENIIDLIIANPTWTKTELAMACGMSTSWLSVILSSDSFQSKLAERRGELIDPLVVAKVEDRLKGVMSTSLDIIEKKLELSQSFDGAMRALEVSSKCLGYGAAKPQVQVNNYVVAMPEKSQSEAQWLKDAGKAPITVTPEVQNG